MARKKKDQARSENMEQLSLFDVIKEQQKAGRDVMMEAGSMNISTRLREELSKGLRQCRCSRYEVAARMSEVTGCEISKSQLDSWTAESKESHRFPAEYLPAFCAVTGYKEPLRMMATLIQCYLLESEEALLSELGRIDQAKRDLSKKEKAIREFLKSIS